MESKEILINEYERVAERIDIYKTAVMHLTSQTIKFIRKCIEFDRDNGTTICNCEESNLSVTIDSSQYQVINFMLNEEGRIQMVCRDALNKESKNISISELTAPHLILIAHELNMHLL